MLTFFIIFELIILSSYVSGDEPVKTLIYIDSSNQIIGPDTHFQITIYCNPGQPIKSYEFNIIFNPSMLSASSVIEGDIFDSYDTFFNKGNINNSAGSIVNVLGLIIGSGNVTDQGSLAVINFTSLSNSGSSSIVLDNVGVANENIYVPVTVSKDTMQIDVVSPGFDDNTPPEISSVLAIPSSTAQDGYVNVTCDVTDNVDVDTVMVNISGPAGFTTVNVTMNEGSYYYNATYTHVGTYDYFIWANDISDNRNMSTGNSFVIEDSTTTTPTVISNIDRITSKVLDTDPAFGWVNITCRVTDNNNVRHVYLNIINPDSSNNCLEMSPIESNKYGLNSSNAFQKPGDYTYYIQSVDDNSNTVNSVAYSFTMPLNYDINMDGIINQKDLHSFKKHYGETGQPGWIREDVDNNGITQVLDAVLIQNHCKESWWLHIF